MQTKNTTVKSTQDYFYSYAVLSISIQVLAVLLSSHEIRLMSTPDFLCVLCFYIFYTLCVKTWLIVFPAYLLGCQPN